MIKEKKNKEQNIFMKNVFLDEIYKEVTLPELPIASHSCFIGWNEELEMSATFF